MRNELNKYLGERVEIKTMGGDVLFLKLTGCGVNYIEGFDDERFNKRVYMGEVENIKVVGK